MEVKRIGNKNIIIAKIRLVDLNLKELGVDQKGCEKIIVINPEKINYFYPATYSDDETEFLRTNIQFDTESAVIDGNFDDFFKAYNKCFN